MTVFELHFIEHNTTKFYRYSTGNMEEAFEAAAHLAKEMKAFTLYRVHQCQKIKEVLIHCEPDGIDQSVPSFIHYGRKEYE